MLVPIALIDPQPVDFKPRHTPRYLKHEAAVAESIGLNGVLEPLTVIPRGPRYRLVDGLTRLRAATKAGLTEVPVTILEGEHTDDDLLQIEWTLNTQQQSFDPVAKIELLMTRMRNNNWTQAVLCRHMPDVTESTLSKQITLVTDLNQTLKEKFRAGELKFRVAVALAHLPPECQDQEYEMVKDMKVHHAEAYLAKRNGKKPPKGTSKKVKAAVAGLTAEFVDDALEAAEAAVKKMLAGIQKLKALNAPLANLPGVLLKA